MKIFLSTRQAMKLVGMTNAISFERWAFYIGLKPAYQLGTSRHRYMRWRRSDIVKAVGADSPVETTNF